MGPPSPATPTSPSRLPLLCLILAVGFCFYPALLGEGLFYFRDVSLNHYPTRVYSTEVLRSGKFPLWNPYLSGGMPLAANPNNLILHPVTLLFLILPVRLAFTLSIVLQYLLAGWAMFRWGVEEGLREEAALLAALTFTLSGPLVSCGSLQNLLSSWAWVPVALFALALHRRTGSRWSLAAYAAALAVQLLAGDPVAAGSTVLVGMMLFALPAAGGEPRSFSRFLPPLTGALLGCALALVGILPAREMIAVSGRAAGIPLQEALAWSVPPFRLLEILIPSLYGDPTTLQPSSYWGGMIFEKGYPFLLSLYLGVLPVLLALAPFGRRVPRRVVLLAGFTGFSVLASLGGAGGLYPLLYRFVPLVSSMRYPSRFMLSAALGMALLAGMGMDRLVRGWQEGGDRAARGSTSLAAGVLLGMAALAIAVLPGLLPRLVRQGLGMPASLGEEVLGRIAHALQASFLRCALLAILLALILWSVRRGWLKGSRAAPVILLLATADLISANRPVNPVVPASFYEAHPPAADLVQRTRIEERVYAEPRPAGFAVLAGSNDAWWGYYWDEVSCRVATCLPWKIPMALDRSTDLLSPGVVNALSSSAGELDAARLKRLAEVASVGLIQSYRDLDDPELLLKGKLSKQTSVPLRLYQNLNALPRAYLVSGALPEKGAALESLTRGGWDPRESVILQGISVAQGAPGAAGKVEWVVAEPERLELRVQADNAAWVVVTDNFYPGWMAEVDGVEVPILRANHLFRSVKVPEGEHRIVFRYAPGSWRTGGAGSLLTLSACGVWLFRARRRPA